MRVILKKGNVKGISLLLDVNEAQSVINHYFQSNSSILNQIKEEVVKNQKLLLAFGNASLRSIFLGIAEHPFDYDKEYLLLKALELIWISSNSFKINQNKNLEVKKTGTRYQTFEKAVAYMEYHRSNIFTTEELSKNLGISQRECNQLFFDYANLSAFAYQKEMRLQCAKELLVITEKSITEIAGEVGWLNASKFSAAFKTKFGLTPINYRKENKLT